MKNYTVTVNGNTYQVSVEENTGVQADVPSTPVVEAQPAPAPVKATPPPAPKATPAATGAQGNIEVTSPMPGKIISVKASLANL